MNKKRLAALALSAVMAAGTVSIPVNAADFSDGAAVQEATAEAETLTVDVVEEETPAAGEDLSLVEGSIEWDMDKATVTYQAKDNTTGKTESRTIDAKKVETKASCEVGAGFYLEASILGQTYTSATKETGDPLGHNYVKSEEVTKQPTCVDAGERTITTKCTNCGDVKDTKIESIDAKGHIWKDEKITYEPVENTEVINGQIVLVETDEDGTYYEYRTATCSVCGEKVTNEKSELKTLKATSIVEGTTKIVKCDNISDTRVVENADPTAKDFPAVEDIILTDCSKAGSYDVEVRDTKGTLRDKYTVTVPAHHTLGTPTREYVDKNDEAKGYLSEGRWDADKEELIVVNYTCLKDVEYNEVYTCLSPKCGHQEKVKKVAAKSDKHTTIETSLETAIENLKDNDTVDYDKLLAEVNKLGKDGKYAKVVNVTATCDKNGTADVELYCQVCGEKATTISGVKVNKLGHKEAYKTENVVEATCQKEGSYDSVKYCDRCGEEFSRTKVTVPKLQHTNNATTDKNAEVFIDFVGARVYGEYKAGQTVKANTIGKKGTDGGTLTANVFTDCTACHNNKVWLSKDNPEVENAISFDIVSVTKETYDKYNTVTAFGTITVKATYTTSEGKVVTAETSVPYLSNPNADIADSAKTGLMKDPDGVYRYYINGDFAEDYAGIAEYNDGEFFVANGLLCKDANGLNLYDGTWYMLSGGQIQRNYTDLALYDGQWFYLTNGELDEEVNGLVNYDGGQFLVINGRLGYEVNGLWQNFDGDWYYLANGQVQNQYTGVAQYDGAFFYVVNGVLDSDYNGTVEYDGETFKVVNGMLQ